jgi:hypothetical protein
MSKIFFILFLLPSIGLAHPCVGIVKDSKGNIYYTDLIQVWKITKGKKKVVVPGVHTHELYIDLKDNLYGEGGYYDDKTVKFYHYLWVYRPNGRIDTVIGMREQYIHHDFALSKDKKGNEYYIKRFLVPHTDTTHLYRKTPHGHETVYATGNFRNVNWLHLQDDGSIFYVSGNSLYRVDTVGNIILVKEGLGNKNPSFKFSGKNIMIWGIWQDNSKNVYAAVFSDQAVKKVGVNGVITEIYKSKDNWAPLHGVFDNDNRLWVLECSDNNEVRVSLAETVPIIVPKRNSNVQGYLIIGSIVLGIAVIYVLLRSFNFLNLTR